MVKVEGTFGECKHKIQHGSHLWEGQESDVLTEEHRGLLNVLFPNLAGGHMVFDVLFCRLGRCVSVSIYIWQISY